MVGKAIDIINDFQVDLIHVNSVAPCQWMTLAAAFKRIPILGHYHTQYQTRERFLSLSHWVDKVVGVSQDVINPYLNDHCNDGHCEVVYNGIDYQFFQKQKSINLKKAFNISETDFALLSVGSLIDRKGYRDLIKSISILLKRQHNVKCVIVGGGPEESTLKQLVEQLKLGDNVFLTGQRYDVGRFYNSRFNAFISTSYNEAFGLVNIEAAFCNKAIIAPDVDGLNEVFTASLNAELFLSNDPNIIADSVEKVMLSPEYLELIKQHGNSLAYKKFTVHRYVYKFEQIYNDLLKNYTRLTPGVGQYLKSLFKNWQDSSRKNKIRATLQERSM